MGSGDRGSHSSALQAVMVTVLLSTLLVSSACLCLASSDQGSSNDGFQFSSTHYGLQPDGPEEIFRSDGGSMEIWSSNSSALQNAAVAVTRLTLLPRGLALPKYCDAAQIAYVINGTAKVGLAYSSSQQSVHVRSVTEGDVIAIPRGVVHWLYNGDDKENFVIWSIADTSSAKVPGGEYDGFYLEGAATEEWGSGILHGFDDELLSHAWDVDPAVVQQIKESQKGTVIIKVSEDMIRAPFILQALRGEDESTSIWENYAYNIDKADPDIKVANGGSFRMLNSEKFPILEEIELTAVHLILEPGALFGPMFTLNAHLLVCVTGGTGRIQVVGSESKPLLDTEVTPGSVVLIPRFHPAIVTSGIYGLNVVALATSDWPVFSYLAGKNALDAGVPVEILAASNNVSVELQQKILDHRRTEKAIFPPRGKSSSINKTSFVRAGLNSVLLLLSTMFLTRFQT
ncbi:unnamed protein product [Calypogeia fissa]